MENKIKKKQLKIEIDESVGQGEYVNFAIVTHSAAEFVLDFIRILPGLNNPFGSNNSLRSSKVRTSLSPNIGV